jgi:hypothetical protein
MCSTASSTPWQRTLVLVPCLSAPHNRMPYAATESAPCPPLQVQKAYLYLQPIFSAPDIQQQLAIEARAFTDTERLLKAVMTKTRDKPNALQTGSNPGALACLAQRVDTTPLLLAECYLPAAVHWV